MICRSCGRRIPPGDKHCVYCGASTGFLPVRIFRSLGWKLPAWSKWLLAVLITCSIGVVLVFSFLPEQNQEQAPENGEPSVKMNYASEDIPITRPIVYSEYVSGSPPIIDGVFTPGEWAEPAFTKPFQYTVNDDDKVGEIAGHFMNDEHSLYIAITVGGDGMQHSVPEDWVWFWLELSFDGNNDDVISVYEDVRAVRSSLAGTWWKDYYDDMYVSDDGTGLDKDQSGEGASTFAAERNSYIYEFQIPLNSGDINDLAVKAGGIVGVKVRLLELAKAVGGEDVRTSYLVGWAGWPLAKGQRDTSTYGKLVLAVAPN